jgi:hypothetical protein
MISKLQQMYAGRTSFDPYSSASRFTPDSWIPRSSHLLRLVSGAIAKASEHQEIYVWSSF